MKTDYPILAIVFAFALVRFSPEARAQNEYELEIIQPWDSSYSLASSAAIGLNNLNQVSGAGSSLPIGSSAPFLWTRDAGKMAINMAGQINDNGVIANYGFVRWPDGTIESLPAPLNGVGAINNADVIAGSTGVIFICGVSGESEGVVWDPAGNVVLIEQQYGLSDADEAWAINIHGQIVGIRAANGECGTHKAFHLDPATGVYTDLHALLSGGTSGVSRAFGINDNGVVVGFGTSGGTQRPILWDAANGFTFLPAAPGSSLLDTHFVAINNVSQCVGSAIVNDLEWHAIVWDEVNGVRDLNHLVDLPADFVIDRAIAINDNGWIIGSGHYGSWSPSRAVVLVPVAPAIACDFDVDGDVDLGDFSQFSRCFAGANNPPAASCPAGVDADLDGDGDVDLSDFGVFSREFTGPR